MPYKIGVSSGWWKIDRPPDLLGLATKVGSFGGTAGVQFIQADLDTTSEFFEPRLEEQLKRIREKMGMEIGLHAEVGELMALESAERRLWDQSHIRFIETVRHSADLGMKYINVHFSNKPQLLFLEAQYRVTGYFYPSVGFDGRPLFETCEKSAQAKKIAEKHLTGIARTIMDDARDIWEREINRYYRDLEEKLQGEKLPKAIEDLKKTKQYQEAPEWDRRVMERQTDTREAEKIHNEIQRLQEEEFPERAYRVWKQAPNACYSIDAAEIGAYLIVAAYMKETGDPIWSSLCNNMDPEKAYREKHPEFNAAVAARYLQGHLEAKWPDVNKKLLKGMSALEWLKEKNIILAFEIPEAHEGFEGLLRLFNPLDGYIMIKKLKSPILKLCIDFEHLLSHKLKVEDMIKGLPSDGGKDIIALHLSKPIPYFGSAHVPIPIGSRAQEIIYKWIFDLRKKGFRDGYLVYERGGGKTAWEVMQNVVWAMRQMVKYLEKDIPFEELPPEFYGVSEQTKETFARQIVTMREHAWDPLEGLLMIPEEKHTFLSRSAVEKGKKEEWEKRRFR
jgi:hypothetical protein